MKLFVDKPEIQISYYKKKGFNRSILRVAYDVKVVRRRSLRQGKKNVKVRCMGVSRGGGAGCRIDRRRPASAVSRVDPPRHDAVLPQLLRRHPVLRTLQTCYFQHQRLAFWRLYRCYITIWRLATFSCDVENARFFDCINTTCI